MVLGRDAEAATMTRGPEEEAAPNEPWHALAVDAVLAMAGSTRDGLSEPDARARLQQYGPNRLAAAPPASALRILRDQLTGVVVVLLLAAAVVSLALGRSAGGRRNRHRARDQHGHRIHDRMASPARDGGTARSSTCPRATVIRDGELRVVDADTLVLAI